MTLNPATLLQLPLPLWIAVGLGLFFGTGAVWHRLGVQIFSRLMFPALLVFGLATAATYVELPGIKFDLSEHLISMRGMELDLAKAFGAGLILAAILRFIWRQLIIMGGQSGVRDTGRKRSARGLYYETAIRLGVLTANADGNAEPREFEALENVFELTAFNAPNARKLYKAQLQTPRPMSKVLRSFLNQFEPASSVCETLILGMATIAAADGTPTKDELGLVRMAASLLKLSPADTGRILKTAGIGTDGSVQTEPENDHFATLGLETGASPKQIHKAYKCLSAKYAPKRLILLALPDAERARADAIKANIDRAYAALTAAT